MLRAICVSRALAALRGAALGEGQGLDCLQRHPVLVTEAHYRSLSVESSPSSVSRAYQPETPRSFAQASITAWSRAPSDWFSRQTSKRDAKRLADDDATAEAFFGQQAIGVENERDRFLRAGAGFVEGVCLRSGARQLLDVADRALGRLLEHRGELELHVRDLLRFNEAWSGAC